MGQAVHTALMLYLYFIATALPSASYTERAWVRQWDAVAGGAGADWATCLRLLERAAADVALDGAASTAASLTGVWGGVFSFLLRHSLRVLTYLTVRTTTHRRM